MARIGQIPKSQLYTGSPQNAFDRQSPASQFEEESTFVDEAALADAAEAIREVEVDAADAEIDDLDREKLLHMNIDELRIVAQLLDIPDREQIVDREELVAAIRRSL
jgi:hypothetical protein